MVIVRIAEMIPSDVVSINEVDPEAGRITYLAEPASFPSPPNTDDVLGALANQHPLIHHFVSTGDGSAHRITDFWTQKKFHASPIYQHVYGPMGVEFQMAVTLPAPRPIVVGIAVSRKDTDFSERDRAVLNVLRPHLAQAWYNAKDQGRLGTILGAASDQWDESRAGLVVLSHPPRELTPGALDVLARTFGPSAPGALPDRVARWVTTQQTRLDNQRALDLLEPLRSEMGGQRVVVRYLPGQATRPALLLLRQDGRRPTERSLDGDPRCSGERLS